MPRGAVRRLHREHGDRGQPENGRRPRHGCGHRPFADTFPIPDPRPGNVSRTNPVPGVGVGVDSGVGDGGGLGTSSGFVGPVERGASSPDIVLLTNEVPRTDKGPPPPEGLEIVTVDASPVPSSMLSSLAVDDVEEAVLERKIRYVGHVKCRIGCSSGPGDSPGRLRRDRYGSQCRRSPGCCRSKLVPSERQAATPPIGQARGEYTIYM